MATSRRKPASSHLPGALECRSICDLGRNNNEQQSVEARFLRHRYRDDPRVRHLRQGRREKIRSRCERYRNQARADGAAQRPGFAVRRARPGRRSLFPDAERKGRHQRPPDKILYQNDDFGRDFLGPFKQVLADAGGTAKVIMEQTYDLTEPTVDSQLINLSKSGADVFYNISTGKAASQSIRKVVELGWKPVQLLSAGSTGPSTLRPAGFEKAARVVAIRYTKESGGPPRANAPARMA